ncbi:MAG TPA: holo-ACP synthase, partial [Anaerolinea sp.]|nr:holo-ACP synthase [Anaerolinea sp.]
MILRSGVDIVEIQRLDEVNPAIRARFIRRVFTENEVELARGSSASLAGRFAAKEAVSKALGTGIGWVAWRDIEILRGKAGEPLLELHGRALQVAEHAPQAVPLIA